MTEKWDLSEVAHIYILSPPCLMMLSGPLDGVRVSMCMATYLSSFILHMQFLKISYKSETKKKKEFQGKMQMNEMWKIKVGEDQHLYKRCSMILASTSCVRNGVQPPQTIYTERLIHFFPHVIVVSVSSTDLLSIYFLLGKKTPT